MSTYHYRGKKYTKKTPASRSWKTIKKVANRVLAHLQPPERPREPEFYVAQVERQLAKDKEQAEQKANEEKAKEDRDIKWMY
jgi:hypothetical protein